VPVAEDDPTVPLSPYGWSKLMTEVMLRDTSAAHPLTHVALRYFNVAGADPALRTGLQTAGRDASHQGRVEAALAAANGSTCTAPTTIRRRHLHPRFHFMSAIWRARIARR